MKRVVPLLLAASPWIVGIAPAQESCSAAAGLSRSSCSPLGVAIESRAPFAGTMLLCGGAKLPPSILDAFYRSGGGSDGILVLIPTASPRSDSGDFTPWVEYWKDYPWREVHVLHAQDRDRGASQIDAHRALLRSATAVWISGGDQSRLSDRYAGTFLENELRALLQRGGALGGTSAGAAICSKTMISEGICDPEFKTGFGFLPEIIIDQHFAAKNRFERLRKAVQIHPGLAGLGIDESTGLLLRGETATVLGEGKVHWYQAQDANPTFEVDSANAFGADREWSDGQAISIHEIAASPR